MNNTKNIENISKMENNFKSLKPFGLTKDERNALELKVNNSFQSLESMINSFGPNYNYDEHRPKNDSYYQPLKNQLETMNFSLFANIVNTQIDNNNNNNPKEM